MSLGKILGSISPAYGMLSGHGLMSGLMGSLSPTYGLLAGKGLFGGDTNGGDGSLGINGFLAHLFLQALDH